MKTRLPFQDSEGITRWGFLDSVDVLKQTAVFTGVQSGVVFVDVPINKIGLLASKK